MAETPDPAAAIAARHVADVPGLQAFVAVARAGTVGRAAEALNRSQPSISARLAALEQAWRTRLFRRRPRGMRLTPEGERLLPLAEAVLRDLEELDRAAGRPVAAGREVRVGAGDALGRELLPRALAGLLAGDATVSVRVVEGPGSRLLEALRGGEIDVALVVTPSEPTGAEDLDLAPLVDSPVDLLLPPGSAGPRAARLETLRGRRLVTLQSGSSFRRHLESAFARRGIPFGPAVEVGNLSLVRRFVAAGLGSAPVPALAFSEVASEPRVERCRLRGVPRVAYSRATRRGVPLPGVTRRLLELLV